jgi:serine/threonine protein phosphatase 1
MKIYAMSDIHGNLELLQEALTNVDLDSSADDRLVLLGDYIDDGEKSCEVLYFIKDLQEKYDEQVVALLGNHEEAFLEWLADPKEIAYFFAEERDFMTTKTFLTSAELQDVRSRLNATKDYLQMSAVVANIINTNHKELIAWLRALPYYYETDRQIFVHAGIDENAGKLWKVGTHKHYFANKFPATTGYFYKDIIAGHVATSTLAGDPNYHEVYWDGISHYYIDGTAAVSGNIPVLKIDGWTYTSFRKVEGEWEEYFVGKVVSG